MGGISFKRLLDIAEVNADCVSTAAEHDLQSVLDRVRAGQLTRSELAALARAVTVELGALEGPIAAATAAVERAHDDVEQWVQAIAKAERHDRPDLAEQARDRLAYFRAGVAAAEAVLFEHREAAAQLREVGRLVLERAGH